MVINTMGWIESIGHEFLLHAMDRFNATLVLILGQLVTTPACRCQLNLESAFHYYIQRQPLSSNLQMKSDHFFVVAPNGHRFHIWFVLWVEDSLTNSLSIGPNKFSTCGW